MEAMEGVDICQTTMPASLYGYDIWDKYSIDAARLKTLREQGGGGASYFHLAKVGGS